MTKSFRYGNRVTGYHGGINKKHVAVDGENTWGDYVDRYDAEIFIADELSFVIINGRGNCGLVRPGDDEGSKVDARETVPPSRRLCCLMIGNQERSGLRATRRSPPDRRYAASRHSYRWRRPPTLGMSRTRCRSLRTTTCSRSSRRQLPIQRSAVPFCQGLRYEMRTG